MARPHPAHIQATENILTDWLASAGMELTDAQDWAKTLTGIAVTGRDNTSVQEGGSDDDDGAGDAQAGQRGSIQEAEY